jgi:SOS-response transcriptional repressor LexA
MTTGEKIGLLRRGRRLSQQKLAELAGLARVTVGAIERGENEAKMTTLQKLARALGVGPSDLVADSETMPTRVTETAPRYEIGSTEVAGLIMVSRYHRIPARWEAADAEEFMGTEAVPASIAREGDVILEVQDDSMDSMFPAGSCVVVDPSINKPYPGEQVIAIVGDMRLLRTLERRGVQRWLVPENRTYGREGIRIDDRTDVLILGVVVGEYRIHGRRRG